MSRKAVLPVPPQSRVAGLLDRALDGLTLKSHALAVRLERLPDGFGDEAPVDETDPKAVRREWRRLIHAWADYSPEQVFALKAGALMLGGMLAVFLIIVAVI